MVKKGEGGCRETCGGAAKGGRLFKLSAKYFLLSGARSGDGCAALPNLSARVLTGALRSNRGRNSHNKAADIKRVKEVVAERRSDKKWPAAELLVLMYAYCC